MEELKIDGIPIEDYGTLNSRSVYCGEINVGQTIKSNIDFWKEKYFELEKNSIPILLIEKKIEEYNDILEYAETEEGLAEIKDFEYDEAKYGKKILLELLDERNNTDE